MVQSCSAASNERLQQLQRVRQLEMYLAGFVANAVAFSSNATVQKMTDDSFLLHNHENVLMCYTPLSSCFVAFLRVPAASP